MTDTKALKDLDVTAEGRFEAVFCTFDVIDADGDVIRPGAIQPGAVAVSGWNHAAWEKGQPPIGVGRIYTQSNEARVSGRLFMETEVGRHHYAAIKALGELGLGEWSWSLQNLTVDPVRTWNGRPARVITAVGRIREVSPVLNAASLGTRTLSAKTDNAVLEEAKRHLAAAAQSSRLELERQRSNYLATVVRAGLRP